MRARTAFLRIGNNRTTSDIQVAVGDQHAIADYGFDPTIRVAEKCCSKIKDMPRRNDPSDSGKRSGRNSDSYERFPAPSDLGVD